jgi:hypothetical protein
MPVARDRRRTGCPLPAASEAAQEAPARGGAKARASMLAFTGRRTMPLARDRRRTGWPLPAASEAAQGGTCTRRREGTSKYARLHLRSGPVICKAPRGWAPTKKMHQEQHLGCCAQVQWYEMQPPEAAAGLLCAGAMEFDAPAIQEASRHRDIEARTRRVGCSLPSQDASTVSAI